ncbi:MAG: HAMP domain-containing histidine kinase [Lachnospiraceae bacterium]|nr:HAMP domain-containing histidine kinase [Lachnospiraceae bacterium]
MGILFRYFLSVFSFFMGFLVFMWISWQVAASFSWSWDNPIYQILHWIREYILLVCGIISIVGWIIITYYYMSKPLRYLEAIVEASQRLAVPDGHPILLPEGIKSVQDQMNLTREQAFRNAVLAKEAEQRKNDLIVYLAHDLKTPLTSVIGYLTLLVEEPQISPQIRAKYTGIALRKAERLEDLINEFFDITRFNLTSLTLEPERTNLSRMLEQMTSEFEPILAEKDLTWRREIAPGVEFFCDRDKMERVFDNLIRNAVNYSYSGTEILVSMRPLEEQVEICFRNHGKTIPKEKLARIFEQFFRVDASRSSATGGAGLGLAISKEIVELHGGSIRAQSGDEQVEFRVLLPVDITFKS